MAVSPGIGFGEYGDAYVRFALIENESRTRQAIRGIKEMFRKDGLAALVADRLMPMENIRITDRRDMCIATATCASRSGWPAEVHRQLRPQLPADYAEKMQGFRDGGEMCVAVGSAWSVSRYFANSRIRTSAAILRRRPGNG